MDGDHYFALKADRGCDKWQEPHRTTCGNVTLVLFDRMVCCACDKFPVEVVGGCDVQAEVSCSTAAAAEHGKMKLGLWSPPRPAALVLQVCVVIHGLNGAQGAAGWSLVNVYSHVPLDLFFWSDYSALCMYTPLPEWSVRLLN